MIRYIPFLKAKQNELNAMSELAPNVKLAICPFFDFPRKQELYGPDQYANTAKRIAKSLAKHWGAKTEFYFDDLDIGQNLEVEGEHRYAFVLGVLCELSVIPVVGISRLSHNAAVARLKDEGVISTDTLAFRVVEDDFEDFEVVKDEIEEDLGDVFRKFEEIDLVLDCRLCTAKDESVTAQQIAAFAKKFCSTYSVRRVVVTGSSIPASSRDVLDVNTTCVVARKELAILAKVRDLLNDDVVTGDYATVSPFYSEADLAPEIMQNVMTARLTYSFKGFHYFIRGSSMKSGGYEQYFALARHICGQDFFRGPKYSSGDAYLHDKSRRIGNNCTPGAVIKPSVVAHISYMVLGANA
ncbi:MAG: hypothetical protein NTV51_13615 [Verrucomicrobia bacterium]|nr:hypothetical protein [Verrucomicrobiota bacterium]